MPVFLIVALEHPRRLGRLIARAIPDPRNRYTLPNYTGFYVWFNGTTLDLAKLLDLPGTATPDNSPSPAVIQMVSAYGGYAPDELWSWLRFNVKREPDPEEEKCAPEAAGEANADSEKTEEAAKAILEAPMPAPRKRKRPGKRLNAMRSLSVRKPPQRLPTLLPKRQKHPSGSIDAGERSGKRRRLKPEAFHKMPCAQSTDRFLPTRRGRSFRHEPQLRSSA